MRFHDALRGDIRADPQLASEDFIIHRRDGLFAYNLPWWSTIIFRG